VINIFINKKIQKIFELAHTNRLLLASFIFFFLFSFTVPFVLAIFQPGETLDPTCAPGDSGCTVQIIPDLTSGSVVFSDGTTLSQDNDNFFWDSTNTRLGIGTNSPSATFQINGTAELGSELISNGTFTGGTTDWTLEDDADYGTNNVIVEYTGGDPQVHTNFETEAGHTYSLTFTISNSNAEMYYYFNSNNNSYDDGPFTDGTHEIIFTTDYTGTEEIWFDDWNYDIGDTWTLDNVSIKEVIDSNTSLKVIGYDSSAWLTVGDSLSSILTVGESGVTKGTFSLAGNTSGVVTLQPSSNAGDWTLTLPANDGTDGQILTTDGAGVTSWDDISLTMNSSVVGPTFIPVIGSDDDMVPNGVFASTNFNSANPFRVGTVNGWMQSHGSPQFNFTDPYSNVASPQISAAYSGGLHVGSGARTVNKITFVPGDHYTLVFHYRNDNGLVGSTELNVALVSDSVWGTTASTLPTPTTSTIIYTNAVADTDTAWEEVIVDFTAPYASANLWIYAKVDISETQTSQIGFDDVGIFVDNDPAEGSVLFVGEDNIVAQDNSNFFWDFTNNRLGLGTSASPDYTFDVNSDATSSYTANFFNDGDSDNRYGIQIQAGADTPSANKWVQFNDGDGTDQGSICYTGGQANICAPSDERLKNNVKDTSIGIEALRSIKVHDFSYNSDPENRIIHGFIAQELYDAYPDAVSKPTDPEEYWKVSYGQLTPLIIKSIQDLDLKISGLASLDLSNPNSLGSLIKTFLADSANTIENIFAKKIHTEQICVKKADGTEFCANGDQLESALSGQPEVIVMPTPDPTPEVAPTPTPEVEPTLEPAPETPLPAPEQSPEPAPETPSE
jgi:hypothetical protein